MMIFSMVVVRCQIVLLLCVGVLILFRIHGAVGFLNSRHHRQNNAQQQNRAFLLRRDMFTGIVEEIGTVIALEERDDMVMWDGSIGRGTVLTVQGDVVMQGAYLGCSICVSGVCLTATELFPEENMFRVGLAPETLRQTYLGCLKPGDKVNLERASEIGGRNSGHFVQGHVDSWGEIIDRWEDQDSLFFKVHVIPDLMKSIVPKGFIAIDGTSLTVCDVNATESWFTFMLVEYTQKKIVLPAKNVGDPVNVEVDVLGKYSESALVALIPRLEQLEANYKKLLAKTMDLEARNHDLEQKIQSLENVRLLDNGSHNTIPNAKMVSGPEAQKLNNDWLRQQQKFRQQHQTPKRGTPKKQTVKYSVASKAKASKRPNDGGGGGEDVPKGRNMVSGHEARKANEEWLKQQRNNDDWFQRDSRNSPSTKVGVNRGPKKMVSGPEAQKVNEDWLRRQRIPTPDKVRFSGPVAQRVNDEWRKQQQREQERFTSVKRVRGEDASSSSSSPSTTDGASSRQTGGVDDHRNDDDGFRNGFQNQGGKFKKMVVGPHAKKVQDEWLQQTGKSFGNPDGIQDATVVERRNDPGVNPAVNQVMTSDQEINDPLRIHNDEGGGAPPNQRPGRNLDIQDATLIDPEEEEKDHFIKHQFEDKQKTNSMVNEIAEAIEETDYFSTDSQPGDLKPDPASEVQDPDHQANNQQGSAMRGEFNDGWFDKSGRCPDQNGDDMMGGSDGYGVWGGKF